MSKLEKILGIKFPDGIRISSATNSTGKVKEDSIFFGLPGTKSHGSSYCEKALKLGASLAVHNNPHESFESDKVFFIKDLKEESSDKNKVFEFLEEFYKFHNLQQNNFFTFTGTNGKTSSAYLCHQLLINQNYDSIYIGTLGSQLNNKKINTSFSSKTTPDIFELFEMLNFYKDYIGDSINICIEISSHALDQKRLKDINGLHSAALLNITNDHLDYHKNFESYRDSKFEIFRMNSDIKIIDETSIIYKDNFNFINDDQNNLRSIGSINISSDIFYKVEEQSLDESIFTIYINNPPKAYLHESKRKYKFSCKLFPEFNIHNLVFAICSIGFDTFSEEIVNNLSFLTLPKGRAELFRDIPRNIIIDYAHNEKAMDYFLSQIKSYFDNVIVVFGCGGDRDKSKRSLMLKTALMHSSSVIFTSDNSRNEHFEDIFTDASKNNSLDTVIKIKNREEAIMHGASLLDTNDCMIIFGKGHEETQEENGKVSFFSDHEVVNEIYK